MEDVSVLQAIFLRENNLRHLSSKLADPAKNNSSSVWMGCCFLYNYDFILSTHYRYKPLVNTQNAFCITPCLHAFRSQLYMHKAVQPVRYDRGQQLVHFYFRHCKV